MTKAPERIWAGKHHSTWWQSRPHHQMTEYIRADHALALVAAEQKEIHEMALDYCQFNALLDALERRTDADAQAALDRLLQEARNEVLREVATICNRTYGGSIGDVHKSILALIEEQETGHE